jgi:hypothetical protein
MFWIVFPSSNRISGHVELKPIRQYTRDFGTVPVESGMAGNPAGQMLRYIYIYTVLINYYHTGYAAKSM